MDTRNNRNDSNSLQRTTQETFLCEVKGVPSLEQAEFIAREFAEDDCINISISHGPPFEVTAECRENPTKK